MMNLTSKRMRVLRRVPATLAATGSAFLIALCAALLVAPTQAAPLGRAESSFENARPGKGETAWGRFVADALRARSGADVALVDAGSLDEGTLRAGEVRRADVEQLLAFGTRDNGVTLRVSGAQLRAAIARAVQDHPTRNPSFLHGSGLSARFANGRVAELQIDGRDVSDAQALTLAMPQSAADGAIFGPVWKNASRAPISGTLADVVSEHVRDQGTIAPQAQERIAPR